MSNLCKSVKSVDKKTAQPMSASGVVKFRPANSNTRRLLNHLAKESEQPIRMEDIPIGPERTDLALIALELGTCARTHQRTCSELGNAKAALMHAQHDDPAVMDLINRIMTLPLGQQLSAAADQLFTAAVKG